MIMKTKATETKVKLCTVTTFTFVAKTKSKCLWNSIRRRNLKNYGKVMVKSQ